MKDELFASRTCQLSASRRMFPARSNAATQQASVGLGETEITPPRTTPVHYPTTSTVLVGRGAKQTAPQSRRTKVVACWVMLPASLLILGSNQLSKHVLRTSYLMQSTEYARNSHIRACFCFLSQVAFFLLRAFPLPNRF